uniref:5'-nucleotidase n=1 Tax=Glossina morsitans morsitans TaxID=37546 RepID=A0A1B0FBT2_GLOMM
MLLHPTKREIKSNRFAQHMLNSLYGALLALTVWPLNGSIAVPINKPSDVALEFIILHNNDMHARFEQTSKTTGKCTPEMANTNKCYGGFARVAYEVRKYRQEAENGGPSVLYLNAGDTYTGTPWFTIFKDNITAAFLNKLKPDAISLGNHEFDENVEGLLPFLNKAEFPVLAANLDLRKVPELAATKSLHNSTVLSVKGVSIGVVGYLTPDTKFLTQPNEVEYFPEIESINKEAARLKAQGVNIIIALGHSGYQMDQDIARQCPDVDLVIGGHTNTFLYNGVQPDAERIEGPYPTVVKQKSGKEVPVVQAYAYTKYLGKLHVQFDKDGNLIEYDGTPILLNASVPRESDVLELLELYRPNITALETNIIGHTKVYLDGRAEKCRREECNMGNMVTDAMVYARVLEDLGGSYWTDAPIAFTAGGGIRTSIEKRSDGSIFATDVLNVLPFNNDLLVIKITGKTVRKALEHSASMHKRDSNGGFLQMSGIHVVYDYSKEVGKRVIKARVRCADCNVPVFTDLVDSKFYNVILPKFLFNGGDGHDFVEKDALPPQRLQLNDYEAVVQYIEKHNFVYPGVEGRIVIINKDSDSSGNNGATLMASSTLLLPVLVFAAYIILN